MIYISHLLPDEEMRELVEKTGAGVESIEFSIAENLDALSSGIAAYKKRLRKIGAKRLTLHGPFLDLNPMTYDREIRKATMLRYNQAYEAALELGAEKIVYHSCLYPDAYLLIGWAERTEEFYREFLEGKRGIEILIENVFDREWVPLQETMRRLADKGVGFCFDAGHAHCYSKIPAEQWAEGLGEFITHVHVHDNLGDRDAHLGVGEGNIPWERLLSGFRKRKEPTYTIECSTKEAVEKSYAFLTGKKE